MSKFPQSKVTFKLNNLKQRIKGITKEFKSEKFGNHITNQLVGKIRKDSLILKQVDHLEGQQNQQQKIEKGQQNTTEKNKAYKANKPNLTFTGRLLNSVKGKFQAKASSIILRIDVSGTHAPYKYKGKEQGKPKLNKEIRNHLAKIGRDPLQLSKKAKNNLSRIIQAIIRERLR